jgi:hypothetical protein
MHSGILLAVTTGLDKLQGTLKNVATTAYGAAPPPSLPLLIGQIVQQVIGLLGVLFLVITVYGGYRWFMAKGNEQEVEKAKETIKAGAIGLVIMLGAYAIANIVVVSLAKPTLGGVTGGY